MVLLLLFDLVITLQQTVKLRKNDNECTNSIGQETKKINCTKIVL